MTVFGKDEISEQDNISLRRYTASTQESPAHVHEFVELVYITSGSATQWVDDVEYKVGHGDLLFINYGQTHRFVPDGSFGYVNILVNPVFVSGELVNSENIFEIFALSQFEDADIAGDFSRQVVHFSEDDLARADAVIDAMFREYTAKRVGYRSVLRGYLSVLFSMLLRELSDRVPTDGAAGDDLPGEIESYIDENCFDRITLADIAAKSFYNPAYFGRLLKKHYGKTFSAYIKEKRMNRATELLADKNLTVDEVIRSVGYGDRKLFYRHFREMFGTSPGEYRKSGKNK